MRDEWDYVAKKRNTEPTGWQSTRTVFWSALVGLGDLIGLGDYLRKIAYDVESDHSGIDPDTLQRIKTNLTSKINQLIQQKQIDLDKLQQKLDSLSSMGFSLTGLARKRYADEVQKTKKNFDKAQTDLAKANVWGLKAQADVDSLKSINDTLDFKDLESDTSRVKYIKQDIEDKWNKVAGGK